MYQLHSLNPVLSSTGRAIQQQGGQIEVPGYASGAQP
jgi:hypothetical protein